MTESTFPFDGVDGDPSADDRGTRRVLLLAGGVVGTLVLAAGGFLLLGGSDDEPLGGPLPVVLAQPVRAATPAPTAAVLPRPFDADLGRNPFKPLYVVPAAVAAVATGPAGGGDPTLPGAGTATSAPAAPAVPTGTGPAPAGPVPVIVPVIVPLPPVAAPVAPVAPTEREHALVLRAVRGEAAAQTAAFTIDGRAVTAKVGDTFGPTKEIRLISLQEGPAAGQWTAVLQVGDGGPFDAVTGQAVSVR